MSRLVSFRVMRALARFPATLIATCLLLLAVSFLILSSASLTPDGRMLGYVQRQGIWTGAGLFCFGVLSLVPYPRLGRHAWLLYGLGVLALCAVFVVSGAAVSR